MKRLIGMIVCLGAVLNAQDVRIAASANTAYVLPELIKRFKRSHPKIDIDFQVGGSGKLRAQIENGANYDLFLSANVAYPQALYEAGMGHAKPVVYGCGALALVSVRGKPIDKDLKVLTGKHYRRIAIANPKTAPYGEAAMEALENAGIKKDVEKKLIYGESISQAVIYTLKAVDGGIVALSALFSPGLSHLQASKHWVEVDKGLYTPIKQSMILLKKDHPNRFAKEFYDFLQSKEAQAIWSRFGYFTCDTRH